MAKRPPSLRMPSLALERFSGPLHGRIYLALRDQILSGNLRKGERLPSSRALARELGISRNTVLSAYDELADQGLTVARVGSGTRVTVNSQCMREPHRQHFPPAPPVATGVARGKVAAFNLATVLRRSHYPSRRVSFLDRDGNALYLYNSQELS